VQRRQDELEEAPIVGLYEPAAHSVGFTVPKGQKYPSGHITGATEEFKQKYEAGQG
jgi:hypothetical protein